MCVPAASPTMPHHWRRRSADVGGLHLATEGGHGQGWMGPGTGELQTRFAELLSDMYTQTLNAVNEHSGAYNPDELPRETRARLIESLDSWHFEPHKLPEEEVLACTLILFEALFRIEGMSKVARVSMEQITALVHHLRRIYRLENSYHNFEHALDVLQATQTYLRAAGLVPPLSILRTPGRMWRSTRVFDSGPLITSLGLIEIFTLYIAAIGHDVGHPGFTNLFMINANTPLSLVFDHKSALEQMHCQLLLRVMRRHGLALLLDDPTAGPHFRKLLWSTVMATDMSVHAEFMERFARYIKREPGLLCQRQIVVCQAVMKCADISNPSRPFPVSEYWAWALGQEWTSQALLEQSLEIDQTVKVSDGPLSEARSQVFFITTFAKPLLDLTVQGVPELAKYARECALNLERWTSRKSKLEKALPPLSSSSSSSSSSSQSSSQPPSTPNTPSPYLPHPTTPSRNPTDYQTAFPLTLPTPKLTNSPKPGPGSWRPESIAGSSCSSASVSGSGSGSNPASPAGSVTSFVFSPSSEGGGGSVAGRPPSSAGCSAGTGGGANGGGYVLCDHAGIRAAGKLSVRQAKKVNRNSWCPIKSPSFGSGEPEAGAFLDAAASGPPPPSAPVVSSTVTTTTTEDRPFLPPPPASAPSAPTALPSPTTTSNAPQTRSSVQILVSTPRKPSILTTSPSPTPSPAGSPTMVPPSVGVACQAVAS